MGLLPAPRKWSNLGVGCINCSSIDGTVDFRELSLLEPGNRYVKVHRLVCFPCFQELCAETPQDMALPNLPSNNGTCYHRCRYCKYPFDRASFCVSCRNCRYCCSCSSDRPFTNDDAHCVICGDNDFNKPQRDIDLREQALSRHIKTFNFLGKALKEERKTGFVEVPGGKIWYETFKTGDNKNVPLLVLPGGPGNPHGYLQSLKFLATNRSVIFYDPLGCGNSSTNNKNEKIRDKSLWTLQRFLEEVELLLWHLEVKEVHLFGHSYGSLLATEFALKHPDKVKSLILAGPCLSVPKWVKDAWNCRREMPKDAQEKLAQYEVLGHIEWQQYHKLIFECYQRYICRMDPWPEEMAHAVEKMNEQAYETMWGVNSFLVTGSLADYDATNRLGEIQCSTLLTRGAYDLVSLETAELYKKLIPNSKLVNFDHSAHVPHIEERVEYLETLSEFLLNLD